MDIAVEYVAARPNVLLWGGGHVAEAIANLLPALEIDHSVADDRPDWVGADRFPSADRREVVSPEELWSRFDPGEFSHLYLLGYDAAKDAEVLFGSLSAFPNFIGFISSASKRVHTFHALRARGTSESALGRIRAPIGVPIGAQTPAEIAISVVAELIESHHTPTLPVPSARTASATPGARR
ncbi:MAG: XdhC family protein, partial [Thermoplasmata archaeon]|nr:XdhC family protein [Thermoplasmata archaeon]